MKNIILLPIYALAIGCMKAPSTEIEKGPHVECSVLDKAVDQLSVGKVESIEKDETAYREVTVSFDVLPPELMGTIRYTVTEKKDEGAFYDMTIKEEFAEKVDGQFKNYDRNVKIRLPKLTGLVDSNQVSRKLQKKLVKPLSESSSSDSFCANEGVSYHKLDLAETEMMVPGIVKNKPGCGGLKFCDRPLKAISLKFDTWQKNDEGKEIKFTHYVTASPDVPFFASMMSNCLQYSMHYQDRNLLVTQCSDVKDFSFGPTPTPSL